jgi:hypothetical protein
VSFHKGGREAGKNSSGDSETSVFLNERLQRWIGIRFFASLRERGLVFFGGEVVRAERWIAMFNSLVKKEVIVAENVRVDAHQLPFDQKQAAKSFQTATFGMG